MPITSTHPEYDANVETWQLLRNMIKGDVSSYVPDLINCQYGDLTYRRRNEWRCKQYREAGYYVNFVLSTKMAQVGYALSKDPKVELPPAMQYLFDLSTPNGYKLSQLIQRVMGEIVEVARVGILTDFPPVEVGRTREQTNATRSVPLMSIYPAEAIINWDYKIENGVYKDILVVLREVYNERTDDGYQWQQKVKYRRLSIEDDGYYHVRVEDENGNILEKDRVPLANGKPLRYIPFSVGGSEDNDWTVDNSPLKSIAYMNLAHYRNSCAYQDNIIAHGQATTCITSSLPAQDWERLMKDRPIVMGNREAYFLGESGDIKTTQLGANQEAATSMRHIEEQIAMIGGHVILGTNANAPVETTQLNMGAKLSPTKTIVANVESLIYKHLRICAEFLGVNPDLIIFQMEKEFLDKPVDPQVLAQIRADIMSGILPASIARNYYRETNVIPEDITDEDLDAEIAAQNPVGLPNPEEKTDEQSSIPD